VGIDGYYNKSNGHTFDAVFGRTLSEIRKITARPELIAETAVAAGGRKPAEITELLARVRADPDLIGLVWFDLVKEHDWRMDSSPQALAAFRAGLDGFAP
jgi:mannan endo-1,4-beta-mannosidase